MSETVGTPSKALIAVTERAAKKARELLTQAGMPAGAIRVSVKPGGCSGMTYNVGPTADPPKEGDHIIESRGLKVYLDPKSLMFVVGTELDYHVSLLSQKFVFNNPNASATCSCGESFTV